MNELFGIEDIAFTAPALYLPIEELAQNRGIEPAKLTRGLGLKRMSVCDVNEDVITLASKSVIQLLEQNSNLKPSDIGRIYIGTESSIDGSKPIGTYVHALVSELFVSKGVDVKDMKHVDVIDMTFACIGAVDAMHNSLYYLYANPEKVAIVVAADIANYDLDSSGEYTQGAGSIAVLLKRKPALIAIENKWGISVKSEHDFFKPIRYEVRDNQVLTLHDEKPIFDGQFSNETYLNRIQEAWDHFGSEMHLLDFDQLLFHLPYAYHGRRIIASQKIQELQSLGTFDAICKENQIDLDSDDVKKQFVKSAYYKNWVSDSIGHGDRLSSDMGNLYTASVFLSLISYCTSDKIASEDDLIFFAYGSGSKAKVFQGKVQPLFNTKVAKWQTSKQLEERTQISFDTYVALRTDKVLKPINGNERIQQIASGIEPTNRFERTYELK